MKHSVEDLSARSRRGELSEGEQKQLRLALDASTEAGLAHRAGLEFDAEDSVLAGDDALAQRVTERLLQNQPVQKRRRRKVWRLAVAGVCLTMAAAAGPPAVKSAGQWLELFRGQSVEKPASPLAPKASLPAKPKPARQAALPAASPEPAPVELAPEPNPPVHAVERTAGGSVERVRPRSEARPEGAAEAFREASRLRREGKTSVAMQRYQELLQRYPSSPEARASEIALGMLHLKGGAAGAGLRYFESYLSAAPGGQLAADALWGKTQALAAMGRNDEARRGLQLLIDRYPRSTYATAARAKLGISP